MEDDKLVPDENGHLDVKYRGWDEVDPALWSLATDCRLLSLDCSFNCLASLPGAIGDLATLTELDCSCNKIESLPPELGRLRRLTVLKANGNNIRNVPDGIRGCRALRTLILSENRLADVPRSLAECANLRVLRLQNNELRQIPPELARLGDALEEISVVGNGDLRMIPKEVRGSAGVILWILSIHLHRAEEIRAIDAATRDIRLLLESHREGIASAREQMEELRRRKRALLEERSSVQRYLAARQLALLCRMKMREAAATCKKLLARRGSATVAISDV